nr:protein-L-isoaspartate(D-aspartate) O-methyltransferase [Halovivax limisalsi]
MADGALDDYAEARRALRETLSSRIDDERVLDAVEAVPRHAFVPPERRDRAYRDRPLPIADDQTISAPHMVAIMCDRLGLDRGDRVLEIGTGCGYHAAVTAELVGAENVFSVEYSDELAERARERLAGLGYGAVSVRVGDGREGWPANAPYDAAYATCAFESAPEAVLEQVRPRGTLLAPIGRSRQVLVRLDVAPSGEVERSEHGAVRFVQVRG